MHRDASIRRQLIGMYLQNLVSKVCFYNMKALQGNGTFQGLIICVKKGSNVKQGDSAKRAEKTLCPSTVATSFRIGPLQFTEDVSLRTHKSGNIGSYVFDSIEYIRLLSSCNAAVEKIVNLYVKLTAQNIISRPLSASGLGDLI